jgi:hypothetical protein
MYYPVAHGPMPSNFSFSARFADRAESQACWRSDQRSAKRAQLPPREEPVPSDPGMDALVQALPPERSVGREGTPDSAVTCAFRLVQSRRSIDGFPRTSYLTVFSRPSRLPLHGGNRVPPRNRVENELSKYLFVGVGRGGNPAKLRFLRREGTRLYPFCHPGGVCAVLTPRQRVPPALPAWPASSA